MRTIPSGTKIHPHKGVTDGSPSARRGKNWPEIDPADHPDVVAHKRAVTARLEAEAAEHDSRLAERDAMVAELDAMLGAVLRRFSDTQWAHFEALLTQDAGTPAGASNSVGRFRKWAKQGADASLAARTAEWLRLGAPDEVAHFRLAERDDFVRALEQGLHDSRKFDDFKDVAVRLGLLPR